MSGAGPQGEREERWRGWMAAAQDGDGACYQKLLTELVPFLRGVVRGRMRNEPAAEDVVQDVLISIHLARHTFRRERPLTPWVRAIARNAVVDWARRRSRAREVDLESAGALVAPAGPPRQELSPGLARAVARLPEAQREAVWLLKVEGLSVVEAAARAGVTPGALKLRAHRGYRALRDLLGGDAW